MDRPNVFKRLWLSLLIFFRFIVSADFAARVLANWQSAPAPESLPAPTEPPPARFAEPEPRPAAKPAAPTPPPFDPSPALHLLAILQREGRLVDFLQEDIASYPDADVGAAVRVVHEGCRKVLADYVVLEPLRSEGEGARVVLEKGFDAGAVRLTGNVSGEPPFSGALRHHGWRAADVRLPPPPAGQDPKIVAPAEVEL
jgi:hypothetical protein